MRESLLEILAEPVTGAPLRLDAERGTNGRIDEGRLVSTTTGRAYPIVRGIPRFAASETYADSFGMQWSRFREVQVDSDTGGTRSQRRFSAEAGWGAEEIAGKRVLDAGCGAGRFAEVAAGRGANLVALDYSSAVDAAARTLARFETVDLVQASLLEPPFRPGVFDFAFCIGVVQHTPDPPGVVAQVVRLVKPGGQYCFTIYARQPWTRLNAKYLIRPLTRRLPKETLLHAIEAVMPVAFPVTDKLFRLPVLGPIARFTIPVATYVDSDDFTREQRYQEAVLDTFDMLAPAFDSPMTAEEVERVLRCEGVHEMMFRSRVPIVAVGTR